MTICIYLGFLTYETMFSRRQGSLCGQSFLIGFLMIITILFTINPKVLIKLCYIQSTPYLQKNPLIHVLVLNMH